LALFLLSLGGAAARVFYYFPLMWMFRHIALTYGITRVLVLLCGGFGLANLLTVLTAERSARLKIHFYHILVVGLVALILIDVWWAGAIQDFDEHWQQGALAPADYNFVIMAGRCLWYFALAVGLYALGRIQRLPPKVRTTCVMVGVSLALLGDAASFGCLSYATMYRTPEHEFSLHGAFSARPYTYCPERRHAPPDPQAHAALHLYIDVLPRRLYTMAYNFIQFDPTFPRFRTDRLSKRVYDLLLVRGGRPQQTPDETFLPQEDSWLLDALGCTAAKLRVVTDVANAESDAVQEMEPQCTTPLGRDCVVLNRPGCTPGRGANAAASPRRECKVEILHFSPNTLQIHTDVPVDEHAWLYYADSWHKDWRCRVNGKLVPIVQANYAFKAVPLSPGDNIVQFTFDGGMRYYISNTLAVFGLIFTLGGMFHCMWVLRGFRTDP
jgi:hypothetical protein